jgi:hypothetical protein
MGGQLGPSDTELPLIPHKWTAKYIPENWMYTYGSNIKGSPRLGAAVVHVPTSTTIYIDAGGTNETRTNMRAELVTIITALNTFATQEWIGISTGSLFRAFRSSGTHTPIQTREVPVTIITMVFS